MNADAERVIERVRALVRMCYPDDMTPNAKRMFDRTLDEEERQIVSGSDAPISPILSGES